MCLTQECLLSRNRKDPGVCFLCLFFLLFPLFFTFILTLLRKSGNAPSILQSILHYRGKPTILDWICVSSQNPNIKPSLPRCEGIRWDLWEVFRYTGRVPMNRLGDFIRRDMREMPSFCTICESVRGPSSDTGSVIALILDFLASRTARNKRFLSYLLSDHLSEQLKWTKTFT